MTSAKELIEWLQTLPADADVAVDEGGLTLVHVIEGLPPDYEAGDLEPRNVSYFEVGGIPLDEEETCSECGEPCSEVIGCPDGAELCQSCFNQGAH